MINSPTLLLDKDKCIDNIKLMVEKANRHNLTLKPHFKTHQSAAVGEWFRDFGITSIIVSSVSMARYFSRNNWKDITIGFPVNIREHELINELAGTVDLSLFVNSPDVANLLDQRLSDPVHVYIEIDTGSGRTGFLPDQTDQIEHLIEVLNISDYLNFKGFYSHPGHSYSARSVNEIRAVHQDVTSKMQFLASGFSKYDPVCCIGDTPCCSVSDQFEGIDEISPGNFVFYDLMQVMIGSCRVDRIATVLAAPVVAKHPERNEIVIHGGAIHLSSENILWSGNRIYGLPVLLSEDYFWNEPLNDGSYLKAISQEHGVLKCSDELFRSLEIGDLAGILPVHSCLTAHLMGEYYFLSKFRNK